jgi:putative flippase GtrA
MTSTNSSHSTVRLTLVTRLKSLRQVFVRLLPELSKFGIIGLLALFVDVGGFNLLRFSGGQGPLYAQPITAKIISTAAATVVSWLGNRYWTFSHTRRSAVRHELLLFLVACTIGSLMAIACLAVSHYVLGLTSPLADNISANVVGLALGTAFRFWAYRTFVFVTDKPADATRVETAT